MGWIGDRWLVEFLEGRSMVVGNMLPNLEKYYVIVNIVSIRAMRRYEYANQL